jgi:hypothetical protein
LKLQVLILVEVAEVLVVFVLRNMSIKGGFVDEMHADVSLVCFMWEPNDLQNTRRG